MYCINLVPFLIAIPLTLISHPFIHREIFSELIIGKQTSTNTSIIQPCEAVVQFEDPNHQIENIINKLRVESQEKKVDEIKLRINEIDDGENLQKQSKEEGCKKVFEIKLEDTELTKDSDDHHDVNVSTTSFDDEVDSALANYNEVVSAIFYHVITAALGMFFCCYTILGIYARIIAWKISQATSFVVSFPSTIYQKLSKKQILIHVSDQSESELSDDSDYDDCNSMSFVREESMARLHQAEEKEEVVEIHEVADAMQQTETIDTTLNIVNNTDCSLDNGPSTTNRAESDASLQESFLEENESSGRDLDHSTPRESSSNIVPVKLKRFLLEKCEELERLGITVDEQGYLIEDTSTTPLKIADQNKTLNRKFHLLF